MHRMPLKPTLHIYEILKANIFIRLFVRLSFMLVVFSLCRILFYWYNRDLFPGMDWERFSAVLIGGLRFDLSGLLYLNAIIILMAIIPVQIKFENWYQKTVDYLFILFNSLGLLVNLADMVYYRTTLRRTTLSVLDQFENESNIGALMIRFIFDYWVVTLIFFGMVALIIWVVSRTRPEGPKFKSSYSFYLGGILPAMISIGFFIGGVRGDFRKSTRPITISNAAIYSDKPEDVYLIVNTPFSLLRTATIDVIKKVSYFKTEQELAEVFNPVHRPVPDSSFRPVNVVIIILESFSMEFSGFLNREILGPGYKGYTPFLDSLAENGITFKYGFANGRKSIDAMPSVLSSIPSVEVPFVLSHYGTNQVSSIASLLKVKGYHSAFFHGAPNGSMGFDAYARKIGFDEYYGRDEFEGKVVTDGIWGVWDHDFFPFFGRKLDDLPQPFCAAMFSLSSHHPFELPDSHKGLYPAGENKMYPMVQYTDAALKDLFRKIQNKPWFPNTLFVITADHVSSEVTRPEYKTAWGQYAVPVVFFQSGLSPKYYEDRIAQQTDILPSVLSYMNYDKPYFSFGKDLFNPDRNEVFNYAGRAYQLFDGDLLFRYDGVKALGLYNYRTDPLLKNDLMGSIDIGSMEMRIQAYIQQYNNRMVNNQLTAGQ